MDPSGCNVADSSSSWGKLAVVRKTLQPALSPAAAGALGTAARLG
jgi:hypothetical protein